MSLVFETDVRSGHRRTSEDPHSDLAREIVAESHLRSASYGLQVGDMPDFSSLATRPLQEIVGQNRVLYNHALPVMETLHAQIVNTHNMVILTDAQGLILHALGDDDFLEKADRVALLPGVDWSEQSKGTNAIGTALTRALPTLIHGDQHYLRVNHFLTCSCAPVLDPYGKVIGALDLTGDQRGFHSHSMALVRMSAQMIENHLFADTFADTVRIHFHARPEFIGTLMEGIAAFTHGGRFLSANRSGLFQLGLSLNALQSYTFSTLFDLPMSKLYEHVRAGNAGLIPLQLHNGVMVNARVAARAPITSYSATAREDWPEPSPAPAPAPAPVSAPGAQGFKIKPKAARSSLLALKTGDAQVAHAVDTVLKVLGHDVPILILGETGTGKEWLAQAIHQDSSRNGGEFVAVNCASIPEHLIESELFGYEEGAFTGARKKGQPGKILQANNGTLFLDEIGDMPLALQGRLLRVLQERSVTPLGSGKTVPLNISLVCATNRPLREMIAQGQFREDLYYRINGLVVRLPALRDRTDLHEVVRRMLLQWCPEGRELGISDEVWKAFDRHRWPGNLRQLHNLLRTACILARDRGCIEAEDLLEDFWAEQDEDRPAPAAPSGLRLPPEVARAARPEAPTAPAAASEVRASASSAKQLLQDIEADAISAALKQHKGNVSAAARALGVSRNKIYRKLANNGDAAD